MMEKGLMAAAVNNLMIEKHHLHAADIKPKASIANDPGVDSLNLHVFITETEKRFLINIPDEDVDNIITVEYLTTYITAHTGTWSMQ